MRKIEIINRVAGASSSRVFEEVSTHCSILCTFNQNSVCTPDCAACDLIGTSSDESKAVCQRKEAGFEIGRVDD